jgi:membrane-associated protease RseP (regulator of RpoE activity)
MRWSLVAVLVVGCLFSGGCALSNIAVDSLPTGVQPGAAKREPVPAYDETTGRAPRAVVPFAAMGAHGNGYANRASLKKDLAGRAAAMGADCILIGGSQINQGPTVMSYGGGTAISQQVQTMSLYGWACMWAPVRLGLQWDKDNKVLDVVPGSPAERAGIVISDRILAIGSERITSDPWAAYRATWRARPGQTLDIEVVRVEGSRVVAHVVPEAN